MYYRKESSKVWGGQDLSISCVPLHSLGIFFGHYDGSFHAYTLQFLINFMMILCFSSGVDSNIDASKGGTRFCTSTGQAIATRAGIAEETQRPRRQSRLLLDVCCLCWSSWSYIWVSFESCIVLSTYGITLFATNLKRLLVKIILLCSLVF